MAKKRSYSTKPVESVSVEALTPALAGGCIVALDVAKKKFVGSIATSSGESLTLFRFEHPKETSQFLELLEGLRRVAGQGRLKVAMEPTGTYGDAIRHQLVVRGIPVWMVAAKKTHDSQALFDDVRSMHDPKCAVLVAKLCAMNLATEWHAPPEHRTRLRSLVELRAHEHDLEERCYGRLEALLARHWPEFGEWMDIRRQKSARALLAAYPSPARVRADRANAEGCVRKACRSRLPEELIVGVIDSAMVSLGAPANAQEEMMISVLVTQASEAGARADALELQMREVGSVDDGFRRLEDWMGTFTAAAMITLCDPRQYSKAKQLEKACGLNLREKSSGRDERDRIRLRITKRGPSLARKLLHLFALRMIRLCPEVRAWYVRRQKYATAKQCAVTAVARKLVRAVFHVAKGAAFDAAKLFDLRRLEVPVSEPAGATLPRRSTSSATPLGVMV
jgi:transposase